jgi:DNA-binding protein YbaB
MELEKFNQAKELQDKIDKLKQKYHKLSYAKKSCGFKVTVEYNVGSFGKKDVVYLSNIKDNIREMIEREIRDISVEIENLEEEFNNI